MELSLRLFYQGTALVLYFFHIQALSAGHKHDQYLIILFIYDQALPAEQFFYLFLIRFPFRRKEIGITRNQYWYAVTAFEIYVFLQIHSRIFHYGFQIIQNLPSQSVCRNLFIRLFYFFFFLFHFILCPAQIDHLMKELVKCIQTDRFQKIFPYPQRDRVLRILKLSICAVYHTYGIISPLLHFFDKLDPVHKRHLDIRQQNIKRMLFKFFQRLFTI